MSQSVEILSSAEVNHGDGEGEYDYEYYSDEYFESDTDYQMTIESMSLLDISRACVIPTLSHVCMVYLQMFSMCFCFQILNKLPFITHTTKHTLSFVFGFVALWLNYRSLISHSILISLVSYILVYTLKYSTLTISVALLGYLSVCEFVFEGADWARVRSLQMILVMKLVSLASDLENGRIQEAPSRIQFFGYIFSISNCIYGPWISFSAYTKLIRSKTWNADYFSRLLTCTLTSLMCFVLSTCYLDWLLPDDVGWSLPSMYKQAVIFRTSHYFVMFMSESFILAAGRIETENNDTLVSPSKIEVPRSLTEVVIFWNVPMHRWLKTYVFKPLRRYGRFTAIIGTYFISSLLHGLNYQLSGILISLAFYTFIEHVLREKLARKLNACVLSKSCSRTCHDHRYNHRYVFVKLINFSFTCIAVYHLSYLGCLIDLENDQKLSLRKSFQRWHHLSYSSHLLALGMAVIHLFL